SDGHLSAEFPGLSDVVNCTDWDSDLPIRMERIEAVDEAYWDLYKTTPKALIAYKTGASAWSNSFGNATSLRVELSQTETTRSVNQWLVPSDFGVQVMNQPAGEGLLSALQGVDFKGLFMALAFFVIIAALVLASLPLVQMVDDRRLEWKLLSALGFTNLHIQKRLLQETFWVIVLSVAVGIIPGMLYNRLVLFALEGVWNQAVHTEDFLVHIPARSLWTGFFVTLGVSWLSAWFVLQREMKQRPEKGESRREKSPRRLPLASGILFAGSAAASFFFPASPALFMTSGLLCLIFSTSLFQLWVFKKAHSPIPLNRATMVAKNLWRHRKSNQLSIWVLTSGMFILFSTGLNRQGFNDTKKHLAGTGGYNLWAETSVAFQHDLNDSSVRAGMGLASLAPDLHFTALLRHAGDDASCLNLNRAQQPTVLGVPVGDLEHSDFGFVGAIDALPLDSVWHFMQHRYKGAYPVVADQTVLQWGLFKAPGDTLHYRDQQGREVVLLIAGALKNSVFQGNLLMDARLFSELWPSETGSHIQLILNPDAEDGTTLNLLQQALSNWGVRVESTTHRLKMFNSVTDTYLTIFLLLGGLGLILGFLGMTLIVRRNMAGRGNELATLLALGFSKREIKGLYRTENLLIPLYAVTMGTLSSLLAVVPTAANAPSGIWMMMGVIVVILLLSAIRLTRGVVESTIDRVKVETGL
ncbi:MAG: FtsX-like permease family protein, partial [Bacteroidales bacterium]